MPHRVILCSDSVDGVHMLRQQNSEFLYRVMYTMRETSKVGLAQVSMSIIVYTTAM